MSVESELSTKNQENKRTAIVPKIGFNFPFLWR